MKSCTQRFSRLAAGLLVGLSVLAAPPIASADSPIAPIQSQPAGASYADWGARWWQWALATPVGDNPLAGADCSGGQSGHVWFLHGVLGAGADQLACSVPAGTALFVPIINRAYAAFLNDPPETRTEAYVRANAACDASMLSASIDGVDVKNVAGYHVDSQQSPLFDIQLPVDNILGLTKADADQLLLSPVAHGGYYLFLRSLSIGTHSIEWQASGDCGEQDVSYTIEVVPRGHL